LSFFQRALAICDSSVIPRLLFWPSIGLDLFPENTIPDPLYVRVPLLFCAGDTVLPSLRDETRSISTPNERLHPQRFSPSVEENRTISPAHPEIQNIENTLRAPSPSRVVAPLSPENKAHPLLDNHALTCTVIVLIRKGQSRVLFAETV